MAKKETLYGEPPHRSLNSEETAEFTFVTTLYDFEQQSGEFTFQFNETIFHGMGIPAHSTMIPPPKEKKGYARCFNTEKWAWEYIVDYRGQYAWRVDNLSRITIASLGEPTFPYTMKEPATQFDKWVDGDWVKDEDAYNAFMLEQTNQEIYRRLAADADFIRQVKDIIALGTLVTGPEYSKMLSAWIDYRTLIISVDRINPQWPTPPSSNPNDYKEPEPEPEPEEEFEPPKIEPVDVGGEEVTHK